MQRPTIVFGCGSPVAPRAATSKPTATALRGSVGRRTRRLASVCCAGAAVLLTSALSLAGERRVDPAAEASAAERLEKTKEARPSPQASETSEPASPPANPGAPPEPQRRPAVRNQKTDGKDSPEKLGREPFSSYGVGGFASPNSDFGSEGGVVLAVQRYGSTQRWYSTEIGQIELGNGVGISGEGYHLYNLLELEGPVSPIVGGSLFDFDLDLNSNRESHDYVSWAMHADAGLRFGPKRGTCFAALTGGAGLNSGTQSRGPGGWFRGETGALLQGMCGPFALGLSARHIDDDDGTVAQLVASTRLNFGEHQRFGLGAALSVTGYELGGGYTSVFEDPRLALHSELTQTMVRATFLFRFGEEECKAEPLTGREAAARRGL